MRQRRGALDRRQRLFAPRQSVGASPAEPLAEPDPRPRSGPCELGQPDRDLLLDRPAQGAHPNDFDSLAQVARRLNDFEQPYNEIAEPFGWNFTREKLGRLLTRLADRQTGQLTAAAA